MTADEAFQVDAEGNRATNPEEEQTNEDTAASCPGQPAADTSVVRFKTFAMPVHYTDCSLCGEDMMQGQIKCQRCGRSTKENNDVQLFRAAKRRTQMLEEVSHRIGKTVDQQREEQHPLRPSRSRLRRITTAGPASLGTATWLIGSTRMQPLPFAWWSKGTTATASTRCPFIGFVSSPNFHGVMINDFLGLGHAMENEASSM